jgi:uncharacterized protein
MKKIELEIVAISQSITQNQSYAVVLGETDGLRKLPIVIGGFEAQAIAVALENMQPSRPLTHDLIKNMLGSFNIELHEVLISNLHEGIFFAKLVCTNQYETIEIDSRTSDAIALAVRMGCPIYTYENILETAGILMDEKPSGEIAEVTAPETILSQNDLKNMPTAELETLLQEVLEHEDYIKAAAIRDELKSRNAS